MLACKRLIDERLTGGGSAIYRKYREITKNLKIIVEEEEVPETGGPVYSQVDPSMWEDTGWVTIKGGGDTIYVPLNLVALKYDKWPPFNPSRDGYRVTNTRLGFKRHVEPYVREGGRIFTKKKITKILDFFAACGVSTMDALQDAIEAKKEAERKLAALKKGGWPSAIEAARESFDAAEATVDELKADAQNRGVAAILRRKLLLKLDDPAAELLALEDEERQLVKANLATAEQRRLFDGAVDALRTGGPMELRPGREDDVGGQWGTATLVGRNEKLASNLRTAKDIPKKTRVLNVKRLGRRTTANGVRLTIIPGDVVRMSA